MIAQVQETAANRVLEFFQWFLTRLIEISVPTWIGVVIGVSVAIYVVVRRKTDG